MKKYLLIVTFILILGCKKSDEGNPIVEPEVTNTAPSVPLKVYPTNGQLCTENPLEFKWNSATDKEGDAISYELEVASDAGFNNIVERTTLDVTNITLALEKGIELNWRVRAKDSKNDFSDFSANWKFYTEGEGIVNYLPFTPTLLNPILNTKVSGNSASLEWSSSDVDGDELVFDLYFGNTTPPILIEQNISDSTYSMNIVENQTYYWKIIVKDGKGGEAIGDVWKFKS